MIFIKEIKKKNLSDIVCEQIKDDIIQSNFSEGAKIPSENVIAAQLNVSRAVVREALQKLREEHVIVTHKGSGSFVANPNNFLKSAEAPDIDFKEFCEIMEFRSCIEFAAIKASAKKATKDDFDELLIHLENMECALDDSVLFTKSDYAFHRSIIKASHNTLFLEVMDLKSEEILKCLSAMNRLNDSRTWAVELHKKIAGKILERDPKGAIDLLKSNGEYNIARFEEFLKSE